MHKEKFDDMLSWNGENKKMTKDTHSTDCARYIAGSSDNEIVRFRPRSNSCYETGWTKEERYIMNKIRSDHIQKLESKNDK